MNTLPNTSGSRGRFLLIWLSVVAVIVLAHFTFFRHMGLYEDDHWMIGVPMCEWSSRRDLLGAEKTVLTTFPQGRPLQLGFGFLLAYASTHAGGMPGAHAVAAALWALNAGLCMAIFWRRYGPTVAATVGLVAVLQPADTTHALVHAVFAVQPAVTLLLLSGLAYARGWRLLSLVPTALTVLTYETCFLPALAWPILFPHPARSLWRQWLTHGLVMAAVLAAVVYGRAQVGEKRVSEMMSDKQALVKQVWKMAVGGPTVAFKAFGSRAELALQALTSRPPGAVSGGPALAGPDMLAAACGAGLMSFCALALARRRGRAADPAVPADPAAPAVPAVSADPPAGVPTADPTGVAVARLFVGGALMVVLAYAAALNRVPGIEGRNSSVNIAAAPGWGVLFGSVVVSLGWLLGQVRLGWLLAPALAAYLFLLAGFHVLVQQEYARAWAAQGEFWKDVAAECPDVKAGTVILYPLAGQASSLIRDQEWADYMVFRHLFSFPPGLEAPRAFGYGYGSPVVPTDLSRYDWHELERDGDRLSWQHWGGGGPPLVPGNVILLRVTPEGRFERVTGKLPAPGVDFELKPREEQTIGLTPHKLYRAMFPKGLEPDPRRRVPR